VARVYWQNKEVKELVREKKKKEKKEKEKKKVRKEQV